MSIRVDPAGPAQLRRAGAGLRTAAAGLRGAIPAQETGRLVAAEAAQLAAGAAHGLTRNLRVSAVSSDVPIRVTATSVRGLGTSAEYGSSRRELFATYRRRGHPVRRRTRRQLPPASREGYVIGPALKRATPAVVELWDDTLTRHVQENLT